MTEAEALHVLEMMAVVWPNADLPDPTAERWLSVLEDLTLTRAAEVVKLLARSSKWWPSFSEWDQCAASVREQARYRSPAGAIAAADPYPTDHDRELAREGIAAARAALAQGEK